MASNSPKCNTNCCVYGCGSRKGLDRTLHFHSFPKENSGTRVKIVNKLGIEEELDRRVAWEKVLLMGKLKGRPATDSMFVCSRHFKIQDYCARGVTFKKPKLLSCAVPSLNLPEDATISNKKRELSKTRQERLSKRQNVLNILSTNMTKKRKLSGSAPVKIEVKEENVLGNDYLMAKGRLKGVLKQLTERSSDEDSDSSDENRKNRSDSARKRKIDNMPTPYHHTYVMKLFDRSVDLARFEEDTPLYPICRAWMQNQPRNPQPIIKRRVSSPEPDNPSWNENSTSDVSRLPPPSKPFTTRIPSPISDQVQNKANINLNYDECPVVEKNELICGHLQRWVKVKKKWIETAAKNEERYSRSTQILQAIYNKAQENME